MRKYGRRSKRWIARANRVGCEKSGAEMPRTDPVYGGDAPKLTSFSFRPDNRERLAITPFVLVYSSGIESYSARVAAKDAERGKELYRGVRPYKEPSGGGCVYVFLVENREIAMTVDIAPLGVEVDALDAKVGFTRDIARRYEQHEKKCAGVGRIWAYRYDTAYPKLLERLVHLSLHHARRKPRECDGWTCQTRHQEFFGEQAAGGLQGIANAIEEALREMGEVPVPIPFYT
ncbi:hypothetical protein B0H15DRAFT_952546 [Mycena belliarum]|uniref:Bacteriophage T5 Orf172 DNA-binding domain-containing protein n=1 Tax=Mycena belliarum TaxID=1033014 RepID=A0AAD6U2K0_9AGAR|nr:hypothetical protein B0H15DRAFT_952546 [Mycena belliae]